MMIPDAKQRPLTLRERILREVRGLRSMLVFLQTKGAARGDCWDAETLSRGRRAMETVTMDSIKAGIERGLELARWLDSSKPPPVHRPVLGVDAFFDAIFLLKFDFYQGQNAGDQAFPL